MFEKIEKILKKSGYAYFYGMQKAGVSASVAYKIKDNADNITARTINEALEKVKALPKKC